ncbi:ste ste20 ysk protein kinase [Ceraceosorus bombacis]|uniref:non-specific serine/threonine protein kinase n=1 Tax=Ceraceosorus bombacis TaxID=401625 RepID=A0A0P1BH36_9BASI|nr:ste ste20 ysk protein kinase [Ceraceosorus bombacis]
MSIGARVIDPQRMAGIHTQDLQIDALSSSPTSYFSPSSARRVPRTDGPRLRPEADEHNATQPWREELDAQHFYPDQNVASSSRHAAPFRVDHFGTSAGPSSQANTPRRHLGPAFRHREDSHREPSRADTFARLAGPSYSTAGHAMPATLTRSETQPLFQTSNAISHGDVEDSLGGAYPRDIRRPSAPGALPPQPVKTLKPPSSSSGSSGGGTWGSKQAAWDTPSTSLEEVLPGWQTSIEGQRQSNNASHRREVTRGESEMLQALKQGRDAEIAQAENGINVGSLVRKTGSSMRRASADFKLKFAGIVSPASGSSVSNGPPTPSTRRESGSVDLGAPSARWQPQDAWVPPWLRNGDGGENACLVREGALEKPHPSWWSPSRTPSPSNSQSGKRISVLSAKISSPRLQPTLEHEGDSATMSKTSSRHRLSRSEVYDIQPDGGSHAAEHLFEFAPDPQASPGPLGSAGRRASRALRNIKSLSGGALRRASMTSLNSAGGLISPSKDAEPSTISMNTMQGGAADASLSETTPLAAGQSHRDGAESRTPRAERQLLPPFAHQEEWEGTTPTNARQNLSPGLNGPRNVDTASNGTADFVSQASHPEPQAARAKGGPLGPAVAAWRRVQREATAATHDKGLAPIEQRQKASFARPNGNHAAPGRAAGSGGGGAGHAGVGQPHNNGARHTEQGRPGTGNTGAGTASGGSGGSGNNAGGGSGRPPPGGGGGNGMPRSQSPPVHAIFKRQELIGRGAYGAVYRGIHLSTGSAVALKVVNLDTPEDDVSDIQREVALLSQLKETDSKNVIKYWGCWLKGPELWIVMDLAEGGSVRTVMKAGNVAEKYCGVILRESLVALAYLHKAGIIHRDIKAANILLTNSGRVMLCDFGVAATLVSSSVHSKRSTFVGTPYWMAPEVITEGKTYDQSADIWSLGITLYEMACGNPPHADQEQMRAIMLIPKSKPPRFPSDGQFSEPMRDFLAACLNEEPKERPSADELAKAKWIKSFAKTSTATLKDLIANYNAWTKTGGMRMSLLGAETADLSDHGHRDSFAFDAHDSADGWEFGTFRGTSSPMFGSSEASATVRGPVRDHPLLRLFDSEDGTPAVETVPANSSMVPANMLESLSRARSGRDSAPSVSTLRAAAADHRPAPPPPQPVASNTTKGSSAHELPNPNAASTVAQPIAATAEPVEQKASFAGTGMTPFRFGGGGAPMSANANARAAVMDTRRNRDQQRSTSSMEEVAPELPKFGAPKAGARKPGSSGSVAGEHKNLPSFANAHEKRPSLASIIHRRAKSSLSSMSAKSTTTPVEQDVSQSNTAATSTSGLSMSPAKNRNGFVLPSGSAQIDLYTPMEGHESPGSDSSYQSRHLARSQSDQQAPEHIASGHKTPGAAQDVMIGSRSVGMGAGREVPASAPVGVGMGAGPGSHVERTPAQAATAALITAQRYAAQTPNYGSRSRSGSRTRPLALNQDGAASFTGQAHAYGRSFSAASATATFRDALGAGHEFSTEGLPPSPSPSSSAFFAHLNGQSGAGTPVGPFGPRRVPQWGGQALRQAADGSAEPVLASQHVHSHSLHSHSQDGGSDLLDRGRVLATSQAPRVPSLKPLDLAAVTGSASPSLGANATSDALRIELSRIVQDLGDWLEVLGKGLGDIVDHNDASAAAGSS